MKFYKGMHTKKMSSFIIMPEFKYSCPNSWVILCAERTRNLYFVFQDTVTILISYQDVNLVNI